MIGPSSSHTAGASRIGYAGYKLLKNEPTEVRIELYNSFSDTGRGHKTDLALLGGAIGMAPDDENIKRAFEIADNKGIKYDIKWDNHSEDYHPNTAIVTLKNAQEEVTIIGYSIGGGRIEIFSKEEHSSYAKRKNSVNTERESYPTFKELTEVSDNIDGVIEYAKSLETSRTARLYSDQEKLLDKYWYVMVTSIKSGLDLKHRAENGMFGDEDNLFASANPLFSSETFQRAISFSLAVADNNARMGRILAAPTAGSCGVLPGIMVALHLKFNFSKIRIHRALYLAAIMGAICAGRFELAGATGGCQAELGVAGAMSAFAGTYLLGGSLKQMENAASFVLANCLGLTCDPICGNVEVPCILRNASITSISLTAIELAKAGVIYPIPLDEIITVMKEVGDKMPACYKETSTGGLAQTETAKKMCKGCKNTLIY